jgi:hypothetical protein
MVEAKTLGADVRFRTTAAELVRDPSGRIAGVRVTGPTGMRQEILGENTTIDYADCAVIYEPVRLDRGLRPPTISGRETG